MEPHEVIWEGKIGTTPLRVGVPHAEAIIAEWDTPRGQRSKVSDSMEEFERAVLFQLLLGAGETDSTTATEEVKAAVAKAQAERPKRQPSSDSPRRRKNPKVRQHRRSRRPPRRF
jgi:hypothetical protein